MKKSMCCKADMIYLGKAVNTIYLSVLGRVYHYCCEQCGSIEWSTEKEKCKYKWYKFDKEKLKELLKIKEDEIIDD